MFLQVIRTEKNVNYVKNKSYTIDFDNGYGQTFHKYNIYAFCDRVWLSSDFPLKTGWEVLYEIKSLNGSIFEGKFIDSGEDENGYYYLFLDNRTFSYVHEKKERPHIQCGEVEINIILSPDMIEGSDKLLEWFDSNWPSFHEANLRIIERTLESMTIEFYDGFLFDKVVRLIIIDIISESYDKGCIESFNDRWLTNVEFRKVEDNMEVLLFNDYIEHRLPEGFDTSVFDNPEFDINTIEHLYTLKEHKNHGVIVCKSLKISIYVNEEKKKRLEEEHRMFFRGKPE